jgi:asparagine synthase (glutamine-hydrolysing)
MEDEIDWASLDKKRVFEDFRAIFNNQRNVRKEAYFDSMTHFDFKCLLPALLHVEDRMSMAHGLESRVPLLDHPLIEFVATVPADVKFEGGNMKHLLKTTFADTLPEPVLNRRDKMGFPVPLGRWARGPLRPFLRELLLSPEARRRGLFDPDRVAALLDAPSPDARGLWAAVALEGWFRSFVDR